MEIRDYLKSNILLFDGGMGTYYAKKHPAGETVCERANRTHPEDVEAIHRAYLAAGCQAIKTNTFSVNRLQFSEDEAEDLIRAGYEIAVKAAGDAYVFADIGPVRSPSDPAEEYIWLAERFLRLGAAHFLFETNGTDEGLHEAAAYIKKKAPSAFVIVSFAAQPDGFTREGLSAKALLRAAAEDGNIDAAGLNCVSGARHMLSLLEDAGIPGLLSAMPNAGYPVVRGSRTFYDGDPAYFASQMAALRDRGVKILGGCCGTEPQHIEATAKAMKAPGAAPVYPVKRKEAARPAPEPENLFWTALCDPAQKPFAVELDSPADADTGKFMDGARQLQAAGASIITIADCPIARARMDSSLMACKLKRELGMDALPHMTCRDRNLNATQALLLGLSAEGIRNVLVVTGDPIPSAQRDEVKSVYNFNSRKLMKYVTGLNEAVLAHPFHVFGALNVNARNFRIQLDLARQKEENGCEGFLTQPVLTEQALENLRLARQALKGKLLGGIIPVVSQKNALYMNSEIAGITVSEKIVAAYEGADRAQGEALAVEISAAVAKAVAPYVDGYYLMTPFGRTALMARIMDRIRADV